MERTCSSKILILQFCAYEMVKVSHFQCKMWPIVMNGKGWISIYQDYSVCQLSFPTSCCSQTVFPFIFLLFHLKLSVGCPSMILLWRHKSKLDFRIIMQLRVTAIHEVQWNRNRFSFFSPILQSLQFWE